MNTKIFLAGATLLTATAAFGQNKAERQQASPTQVVPSQPALNGAKSGGSSVVIRQSGSGNRAVVRQSPSGTTTEVVSSQGGTNSVEVHHDGQSRVTIEQRESSQPNLTRPDTSKRNK